MGKYKKIVLSYEVRKRMLRQTMKKLCHQGQSQYKGRLSVQEYEPHWELTPSDTFGVSVDDGWTYCPAFNINEIQWNWWLGFIPYFRRRRLLTVLIGSDQNSQVHAYLFNRSFKSVALEVIGGYANDIQAFGGVALNQRV